MNRPSVGIPYGYVNFDGSITCPACGLKIKEKYEKGTGEKLTHNYQDHWLKNHGDNADRRAAGGRPILKPL